jgi:pilus assembly protein Flp/PilA
MHSITFSDSHPFGAAALRWWMNEEGVAAIEYGLVAALIVIVCVGAFTAYADALSAIYQKWADAVLAALP